MPASLQGERAWRYLDSRRGFFVFRLTSTGYTEVIELNGRERLLTAVERYIGVFTLTPLI